jgi:mono/diheme cytochrome c family protein
VATIRRVRRFALCLPVVILAGLLRGGPLLAQASPVSSQHTVWDGVYSETQARRGEQVFKTECSYCHKEDLSGGFFDDGLGRAPALAGKRAFDSSFLDRWGGMTLADLVSTIAATMPQKRPASLSLENYIDVASYLLSKNDVPAGAADLPGDVDALARIGIVARGSAQAGPQPGAGPSYTDEQSTRGEAMYTKSCGPCHDDKSLAPLLQGDAFLKNWSDKTVAALFEKILTTMPLQDPGSLNEQQSVDLAAYILKLNHFSPGQEALPSDAAALGAMRLTPR